MNSEQQFNAILQELGVQRNLMGDRAINLAAELAQALARVKELEDKLAALTKGESNVVELKKE